MHIKKVIKILDQELNIETGNLAKQANGSVMVSLGETVVLAAVTSTNENKPDQEFFPLSVNYVEKFYSSGRIPGGFFKREARPSSDEIIASRLTDRPLRPLFPKGFMAETQVSINVLSFDEENSSDVLGTIASSAALMISDIPWDGPVGCVRIAKVDGKFTAFPKISDLEESEMDVIITGTNDSIVMVEGKADFVSEDEFLSAIQYGHEVIKDIVKMQNELAKKCGKKKVKFEVEEPNAALVKSINKHIKGKISKLNKPKQKDERYNDIDVFIDSIWSKLKEEFPENEKFIKNYINDLISDDLRKSTLEKGVRADGRDYTTIRNINIDLDVLPRAHGSAVFTRGETQALVVATLGSKRDEQMIDSIRGLSYKNYMLHYNFPPFSVGEARPKFSLSRREVGHGNLAERSIESSLPKVDKFPYTIRIVSEILESNGSSSMATVCGATLALMDAGVPIKEPIAGIAMGLIKEGKKYAILTDILGTEDHLGDMDFKVAGSKDGITAIQMDLKIDGLPIDMLREALYQARDARLELLDKMNKSLSKPRKELSKYAPKIETIKIPVDRIGEFIGPGGKNIKQLSADYNCEISIEDDGSCTVFGTDAKDISNIVKILDGYNLVPEVGKIYNAEVVRILDFGAFVSIAPGTEGLVHISEVQWTHTKNINDILKIGDKVKVKLIKKDDMKRLNFSIKATQKKDKVKSDN